MTDAQMPSQDRRQAPQCVEAAAAMPCRYLTIEQAAAYLLISVSTIYAWVHKGKGFPHRKHGNRLAFTLKELDDWSDRQSRPKKGEPRAASEHGNQSRSRSLKTDRTNARKPKLTRKGTNDG